MDLLFHHAAGGLATGADESKTAEERTVYGGLANAILDPCYHQANWYNILIIR